MIDASREPTLCHVQMLIPEHISNPSDKSCCLLTKVGVFTRSAP